MADVGAELQLSGTAQWSDGSNFDGTIVLVSVPPELGAGNYPKIYWGERWTDNDWVPIPRRSMAQVVDGALINKPRILRSDELTPPGNRILDFWFDGARALVATGAALLSPSATPFTLTVPTLTAPTAETTLPNLTATVQGVVQNTLSFTFSSEIPAGAVDGVNKVFTTTGGKTITFVTAPVAPDTVEVITIGNDVIVFLERLKMTLTDDYTVS